MRGSKVFPSLTNPGIVCRQAKTSFQFDSIRPSLSAMSYEQTYNLGSAVIAAAFTWLRHKTANVSLLQRQLTFHNPRALFPVELTA